MKYFLISLIPALLYIIIDTLKALHMLQQNWYNDGNRYLKWITNNKKRVFLWYDAIYVLFLGLNFFIDNNFLMVTIFIYYLGLTYLLNQVQKKEQLKKPLDFTKRIRRLCYTIFIIYLIPILSICLEYNHQYIGYYYFIT